MTNPNIHPGGRSIPSGYILGRTSPGAGPQELIAIADIGRQLVASAVVSGGSGMPPLPLSGANGGTGVANTGKTITIGGNLAVSGAFTTTLTVTADTSITLPTTGTLATLAGTETLTNKTISGGVLTGTTTLPGSGQIDSNGQFGIGGAVTTANQITVSANATGATTKRGASMQQEVQSDVTTLYISYLSSPAVENDTFTITDLRHFQASQGTFGASATVTNQAAFYIGSGITGATNNYGFFSALNASGSSRWFLYGSGTAPSLLNGALTVTATGSSLADQIYDHDVQCTAQLDKTSDTAVATITGMTVALVAGKSYNIEGWLSVTSGAGGGLKALLGAGGGLTATSCRFNACAYNGTTLVSNTTVTALATNFVAANAVFTDVYIKGSIVVNAGGNILVRAAQNTSDLATTSVYVGSIFSARRIN